MIIDFEGLPAARLFLMSFLQIHSVLSSSDQRVVVCLVAHLSRITLLLSKGWSVRVPARPDLDATGHCRSLPLYLHQTTDHRRSAPLCSISEQDTDSTPCAVGCGRPRQAVLSQNSYPLHLLSNCRLYVTNYATNQ